jgi:hypothetical protein
MSGFTQHFGTFACSGDSIACSIGGVDYEARLVADTDTTPMDYDSPGWCFDTKAPGRAGARNRRLIEAWKRDEWAYCGVVIGAAKAGVELGDMAALWGVEVNMPSRARYPNAHLRNIANSLLDDARESATKRLAELAK